MQFDQRLALTSAMAALACLSPYSARAAAGVSQRACPVGAIQIEPGWNVSGIVQRAAPGAVFCLKAGVYRMQHVAPKDGQSFYGEQAAILNGARLLTAFDRESRFWVATGQTQRYPPNGQCAPNSPACNLPEALFIDDKPLRRVLAKEEVVAATYYFDHVGARIYLADDPQGRKVEASVTRFAFDSPASDVRISNIVVEKYANASQQGAINGRPSKRWVIDGVEARWNSGAGVSIGSGGKLTNSNIHHNGQLGVSAGGEDLLIADNEIWANNIYGYDFFWEAGGIKVTVSDGVTVLRNRVHHNVGVGIWGDIECRKMLYEKNLVEYNAFAGIFHEISYGAIIRDNVTRFNGQRYREWFWGAEIQVAGSENVEVYNNQVTVLPDGNGIVLLDQNRMTPRLTRYKTRHNHVHGNTITYAGSGNAGGAVDTKPWAENYRIIGQGNNQLDGNTYKAPDCNRSIKFAWGATYRRMTFDEFRRLGQEANGHCVVEPAIMRSSG